MPPFNYNNTIQVNKNRTDEGAKGYQKADIIESKQPHTLDLGNVCAPRFNNGGARAETYFK